MVLQLGVGDVVSRDEAAALITAAHTHHARVAGNGHHSLRARDLVPLYNGQRRLESAPGACWIHMLVLHATGQRADNTQHLITTLRRVSVTAALLTLAAVFWCGFSIGGRRTACLAALICAANPVFIYYARLASPAMLHTAWALMSIAAALWAIRPLKPPPSAERQLIGWLICGLCLGAATLTAGPITAVTVVMPILLLMLMCQDRVGHLMGLLAAMFMGMLTVMPWVLYVHEQDSSVWQRWIIHISIGQTGSIAQMTMTAGRRAVIVLTAALPWTVWYIAAVMQPISTSSRGQRIRMMLGLVWFVLLVAALGSMPQGDNLGHWLAALPASAVMLGQLISQYDELASTAYYARLWRWLRLAQVLIVVIGSVALPIAIFATPPLVDVDAMSRLLHDPHRWAVPGSLMIGLLLIAVYSARWADSHYPAKAATAWAVWALVVLTTAAAVLPTADFARNVARDDARNIIVAHNHAPVYWLGKGAIDPTVLLYAGKPTPQISLPQFEQLLAEGKPFYLLGPRELAVHGDKLKWVASLVHVGRQLWRFEP